MPAIEYLMGDATAPAGTDNRIVCHVCNDAGGWGRGFVVAISRRWPGPEAEYRAFHRAGAAAGFELGATQLVAVGGGVFVANMIAQHGMKHRGGVPPIRYEAVRSCLRRVAEKALELGASVHMPRIGCGLAGGHWSEIEPILVDTLSEKGIRVCVYDFEPAPSR